MDIISFSQGKKAQKEVSKLQKDVGNMSATKHGIQDVKGNFENVDKRLEDIEFKLSPGETNKMISDATKKTMINLMKHQFKIDSIMQSRKESFENMIFDSFLDDTGIDKTASKNVTYDNKGFVKQTNTNLDSELVLKDLNTKKSINKIFVDVKYNEILTDTSKVDVTKGSKSKNIVLANNNISLDVSDKLYKEGFYESEVIDLGLNTKSINKINMVFSTTKNDEIEFFFCESEDGIDFSEYLKINENTIIDKKTKRFIKIKAVLKNDFNIVSQADEFFNSTNTSKFTLSKNLYFAGASLFINSSRTIIFDKTNTLIDGMNIRSVKLKKSDYKSIERFETTWS